MNTSITEGAEYGRNAMRTQRVGRFWSRLSRDQNKINIAYRKMPNLKVIAQICGAMRNKRSVLPVVIFIILSHAVFAQKASASDSVWCDNLENIIRCASLDMILEPVGINIADSSHIASFIPRTRLSRSMVEMIGKDHNKVTYMSYLYSAAIPDKNLETHLDKWYKKVKTCLPQWDDAMLPNADKSLSAFQDHIFTNSEDETSVRLDIVHTDGYHVRIRIY